MLTKKAFEMSFSWLFALLIGAAILSFAIFAAFKLTDTFRATQQTTQAKDVGSLLSSFETSVQAGIFSAVTTHSETRIFNNCSITRGSLGAQGLSVATKSGVGTQWALPGNAVYFPNQYIFSSSTEEGTEFYLFSKPFVFPFKIGDVYIMWSNQQHYCFSNPPQEIAEEIMQLNLTNIHIQNCPSTATKVCFGSTGCDITVNVGNGGGTVTKKGQTLRYVDSLASSDKYALLYGAIFADPVVYTCEVQRLLHRGAELARLYRQKSQFLTPRGCGSERLQSDLDAFTNAASQKNPNLAELLLDANDLKLKNDLLVCKLF